MNRDTRFSVFKNRLSTNCNLVFLLLLPLIAGVRRASDGRLHEPKESHDEEITEPDGRGQQQR